MTSAPPDLDPAVTHSLSSTRKYLSVFWGTLDYLTPKRVGALVFFLALFSSMLVTYGLRPLLKIERPLGGEGYDGYIELAQNLATGNGYIFSPGGHKVFHRPPLYPLLLVPGTFLPLEGCRFYVAVLNSSLLGIAAGVLFYFGKLLFGHRTGAVAALIFALNPFMLISAKNAVPAILQTLAYLLVLYLTWSFYQRALKNEPISFRIVIGYAAALWAGVMCHGTMLANAVIALSLLCGWALWRRNWPVTRAVVLTGVLLGAAIAPWTWRNYQVTGMFIPVVGNSGLAYFAGNAHWGITQPAQRPDEPRHEAELRHMGLPPERAGDLIRFYGFTDSQVEQLVNQRFKEHVVSHPVAFAKKIILNGIEYYWPLIYYFVPPPGTHLANLSPAERFTLRLMDVLPQTLYNAVLFALAAFGLSRLWRMDERFLAVCLAGAWAIFALPYFPFLTYFLGRSYYTFGTYPVMILLASVALLRPNGLEIRGANQ